MISARSIVLSTLLALPILIFAGVGAYAIWQNGSLYWVWWVMSVCGLAAWGLSCLWNSAPAAQVHRHQLSAARHWTPRDREAAEVVRKYQQAVDSHTAEELVDPHFYLQQVQALSTDLVKLYHPRAADPFDRLTVPELLAAVRLAVDDLERWMLESVPGSRMLTVHHWRMLPSVPGWLEKASQATWAASILLNPANIARYFASKWSWDPVAEQLQSELLSVVYLKFMRQVGFYLIEMNSGRLRGGADAYRSAFDPRVKIHGVSRKSVDGDDLPPVTIALVGQVSSGKSSLINLLTGTAEAAVDILPETRSVQRFQATLGDPPITITLLDTPGYGESGATQQQLTQIQQALAGADAALLVMDAHSPAREADRQTLNNLKACYDAQRRLKPPPVVGVLTHVDLLPPPLEWSPPYDWRRPTVPKAQSLHDAVDYAETLFAGSLAGVVPVCADNRHDRTWGIAEELLPLMVEVLDDAHSVALLRAFESLMDRDRWKTLLKQMHRGGRQLLRTWIDERLKNL